jgi:hypothetical protein
MENISEKEHGWDIFDMSSSFEGHKCILKVHTTM